MSQIKIIYKDIHTEMQKNSTVTVDDIRTGLNLKFLSPVLHDIPNYGTFEKDRFLLNGSFRPWADDEAAEPVGYVSSKMSGTTSKTVTVGEDEYTYYPFNTADTPIKFTRTFNTTGYYTSEGVTVIFDKFENVYPGKITVKWYKDNTLIDTADVYPKTASPYCMHKVEMFNKMEILCYGLNIPNRYMRVFNIYDGEVKEFSDNSRDKLINAYINTHLSIYGIELKSSTLEFEISTQYNDVYVFSPGQVLDVYIDNKYFAKFYIISAKRKTETIFTVYAADLLEYFDKTRKMFDGYSTELSWVTDSDKLTLQQWFNKFVTDEFDLPVYVDESLKDELVIGTLQHFITYRTAIQMVLMKMGACLSSVNTDGFKVIPIDLSTNKFVNKTNTYSGGDLSIQEIVTQLKVYLFERSSSDEKAILETIDGTKLDVVNIDDDALKAGESIVFETKDLIHEYTFSCYPKASAGKDTLKQYFSLEAISPYKLKFSKNRSVSTNGAYAEIKGTQTTFKQREYATISNKNVTIGTLENVKSLINILIKTEDEAERVSNMVSDYYLNYDILTKSWIYNGEVVGDTISIAGIYKGESRTGIIKSCKMEYYGNKIKCTGEVLVKK